MDHQQVFNTVANHLLTQNKKSQNLLPNRLDNKLEVSCAYRGDNGCKCAIGILIPDEKYDSSMEGKSSSALELLPLRQHLNTEENSSDFMLSLYDMGNQIHNKDTDYLNSLQDIHDNFPVDEWGHQLLDFANRHSLKIDEVPQLLLEKESSIAN